MRADGAVTVILTTGLEDGGRRAAMAFGLAPAVLARGNEAHVFLTLDGAALASLTGAGDAHPRGFSDPLQTYIGHFLETGGRLEVCSSCHEECCRGLETGGGARLELHPSATLQGLSVLATRAQEMPIGAL
ncbi:MAG: hypothetical protein JW751_26010 [Polyangiaceae bacterium]|nr:hypothetical protein [Polyangiaceae bacterium]